MKTLTFSILVVFVILSSFSCKKDETTSKTKTFVESMSFIIDYAEDDGTNRIYSYRMNYSADLKATLLDMDAKGGSLTFYISNSSTDEKTLIYYQLPLNGTQSVLDKGPFNTSVKFSYTGLSFNKGVPIVNIGASIPEVNTIESATVKGKFVITLP